MVSNVNPLSVLVDPNSEMNYTSVKIPLESFKVGVALGTGRITDQKALEVAVEVFKKKIERASQILNTSVIASLAPEFLLFNVYHSFQYFVEDKLNRLLAESPNQDELLNEWSECKVLIAELRYKPSVETFKRIRLFCDKIEQQLRNYENYDSEKETAFWVFYRYVMSDGDLVDLSVAQLSSPNWNKKCLLTASVSLGIKYRNFVLLKMGRDLSWLCEELEKILEPFKSQPQSMIANDSQRILAVVNVIRNTLIPAVNRLVSDDLEFICNDAKYFKPLLDFFNGYNNDAQHPLKDREMEQKEFSAVLSEYKDCLDSKNLRILDLSRKLNAKISIFFPKDEKHVNLGVLRKSQRDFFPIREKCHQLFDAYFMVSYFIFRLLREDLINWSKNRNHFRVMKTFIENASQHENPIEPVVTPTPPKLLEVGTVLPSLYKKIETPKTISEEERLKLFQDLIKEENEREKTKKEKQQRKTLGQARLKTPSPPKDSPEPVSKLIVEKSLSTVLPLRRIELHPQAVFLTNLISSVEMQLQKNALRHALQAYEDLEVLKKRLKGSVEVRERLAIVSMVALSAHKLLEQSFRFSTVKEGEVSWEHNLKTFNGKVKVVESVWKVALKVNLANVWVDAPYVQYDKRTRLSYKRTAPPQLLVQVIKIDETPDSEEAPRILSNVNGLIKEVLESSQNYEYASAEVSVTRSHREVKELKVTWDAKIEELERIQKCIHQINAKFDPRTVHAIFLKQAAKNLNTLKGLASMLGKPILSNELSLIVRNIGHFEHLVCQNLMRSLIYLQKGKLNDREHDLCKLYDVIKWDMPPTETERKFLNEYFFNVHHDSSYMFSNKSSESKLHSAMLAAEMFRERAELDEGFQLEKGLSKTPLNYIPVDSSLLKAEMVMQLLSQAHTGMMKLIEGRLLPQLKAQAV